MPMMRSLPYSPGILSMLRLSTLFPMPLRDSWAGAYRLLPTAQRSIFALPARLVSLLPFLESRTLTPLMITTHGYFNSLPCCPDMIFFCMPALAELFWSFIKNIIVSCHLYHNSKLFFEYIKLTNLSAKSSIAMSALGRIRPAGLLNL